MLTVLDRYIIRSLLINFIIGLSVMISMYVMLDLFVNMDEFTEAGHPPLEVVRNIIDYYWPNVFLYYAQLAGAITLFACVATVARMRKQNELTAVLASGVSLYRLACPIFAFGILTTTLLIVDREIVIPRLAHLLARDEDDADGARTYEVLFLEDKDNALLCAGQFHPIRKDLRRLLVLQRDASGSVHKTWEADKAVWEPPTAAMPVGRWRLGRGQCTQRRLSDRAIGPREDIDTTYPEYYESELSPEDIQARQTEGWIRLLSLQQLADLKASGTSDPAAITRAMHARRTAPVISLLLLLLGLPFFLDRSAENVLGDAGKCMFVAGLCYASAFVAQFVRPETVSALPSWIPIFVFGTIAIVLIDRIRT